MRKLKNMMLASLVCFASMAMQVEDTSAMQVEDTSAMQVENTSAGISTLTSRLQLLRNGAQQAMATEAMRVIGSLDKDSQIVMLDAINRTVGASVSAISLMTLTKIKELAGDSFDQEGGYGVNLWHWLYDSDQERIRDDRYNIEVIRSMISKLNDTVVFNSIVKPVLIKKGLNYYIPQPLSPTKKFSWTPRK